MDNILLTICARGGSKGVPRKNIRPLNGKPLIYYTIKQALNWGKAKHVIVTTDSEEIAKIAKESGAEVPFIRPGELATDTSPTIPVLKHALKTCEKFYNNKFNIVMDLAVTAPIRKVADLENAMNLFLSKKPKSLFSVVPAHGNPYYNMVEISSDGTAKVCKPGITVLRRQNAPPVYDMNASIYIYDRKYLLDKQTVKATSDNSIIYVMDELSRTDIDSEVDFKMMEFLIKEGVVTL